MLNTLSGLRRHSPPVPIPAGQDQHQEELWQEVVTVAGPSSQGRRRSTSAPGRKRSHLPGYTWCPKGEGIPAPGLFPALQEANPPAALAGLLELFIQGKGNWFLFPSHSLFILSSLPSNALLFPLVPQCG